jgi:signal transduction histidine kinase
MNQLSHSKTLQGQFQRLFFVLVLITSVNAAFFWKTLNQLFNSYRDVTQSQRLVALAGDLERSFFEENKLRDIAEDDVARKNLSELRANIRKDFKLIRDDLSEKNKIEQVKQIEKAWNGAHDNRSSLQLLIMTRQFISKEQSILQPLVTNADAATQAVKFFVSGYLAVFAITVLVMSQYLRRRIFAPLRVLSRKMSGFQAGNLELPPQVTSNDEISELESRFYDMAARVTHSFSELKELDKVKTDFISIASHELRTPMTAVKGSLSLILSGVFAEIPAEVRELLVIAEKESDRLIRLINDILDLTKMEAKKLPLKKEWADLNDVIKSAVQGIGGLLEVTKVRVEVQPLGQIVRANIDRDRIQQVVTNLLSNAVKYSPAGSAVRILFQPHESGILVAISDSGPGIKPEDQGRLFEKFRSTDSSKSKIIKGTGLGLPISKAIVEQHNGQIGVQSQPGQGSTFYFILPEVTFASPAANGHGREDAA